MRRKHATHGVDVQTASGQRVGAPGRGDASRIRGQKHARAARDGTSGSELQPATGGALFRKDGMLLLPATDARSGRSAQDAGGFRDRSEAAARAQYSHAVLHLLRGERGARGRGMTAMASEQTPKSASLLQVAKIGRAHV